MTLIQRNLFIGIGIAVVIVLGLFLFTSRASAPSQTASTTTQTLSDGTVVTVPAGATVTETEEPVTPAPVAPNYNKPVAYNAAASADLKAAVEARLPADRAALNKNKLDFSAWMDLAILYKIGGDYRGAEAIWLYATKQWATSPVAFHNLGDLYENFLHDSAKAKIYYDEAAKRK